MKQRLLGAVLTVAVGLFVVIGANHPWFKSYGLPWDLPGSMTGGIVVGLGNQACIGFELWGAPGFFGSFTDAGACDY